MDTKNRFHTAFTYWIVRAEHAAVVVVGTVLVLLHFGEVHWWRAFAAFWIIDLIGYLPGMIAYRRAKGGSIAHWYHHSYNIAHTYLVAGSGVALWIYLHGGLEWAMLAVPIHLSIDRGIFGNTLKPVELAFEPEDHSDEAVLRAMGRRDPQPTELPASPPDVESVVPDDILTEILTHPSGYLALSKRNAKFVVAGIPGFIAYRRQGKHLWMFGGIHAAAHDAGELLDRFLQFAVQSGRRVGAVQVQADQAELFASRGFTVNQMGTTYATSLADYSFSGGQKMQLRNKINHARRLGLKVVELGREVPRNAEWFAKLEQVSASWLAEKGKKELDFMIGELGDESDQHRRIFLALDAEEKPVAFISYVPVWGSDQPGYLHDLTRKVPDAAAGVMELCNATAIERFKQEGVKYLHFGFTPFIVDPQADGYGNRLVHRIIQALRKYGEKLYPADTQEAYKLKWGADMMRREYLAVRPVSPRAVLDLLLVTRSV
jgi:phosphatidylglycerol lysyltransferase-like protein